MICWVYLHFRFRLPRLASLARRRSPFLIFLFPAPSSSVSAALHTLLQRVLLALSHIIYSLRCLFLLARATSRRFFNFASYWKGCAGFKTQTEARTVGLGMTLVIYHLEIRSGTCLCTFKEWLGGGVTPGGVVPPLCSPPRPPSSAFIFKWPLNGRSHV